MTDKKHIVCPHCHATNAIPAERLADKPNCGKCKEPLFVGKSVKLTHTTFSKHINNSDQPVVVDFWAPWCRPCQVMGPSFEKAAEELEPNFCFGKVDTEVEQQIGAQYNIRSIPCLVIFKNGVEVTRQAGSMGAADIIRWVQANA